MKEQKTIVAVSNDKEALFTQHDMRLAECFEDNTSKKLGNVMLYSLADYQATHNEPVKWCNKFIRFVTYTIQVTRTIEVKN